MNVRVLSLSVILIVVLGITVYCNSLNGKFILDDDLLIKDNAFLKNSTPIGGFLTTNIMAGAGLVTASYRPFQIITYKIDYSIWKLNPTGYHLTNMLLHIFVGLCIYWLINILYNDNKLSFATSALFVIHPIHTEAVSYISGRADSLCALFMLLCLIIYTKHMDRDRMGIFNYALLLLAYALALLSKEMSVILPLLLLFYHFVFKKKIRAPEFLSLLGVLAAYIAIRLAYLKPISALPLPGHDAVFDRIPGFFAAMANYIKLLVIPFPLHMEYGTRLFAFTDPIVITGIVITFTILALVYLKRKDRVVLFSAGWFFLTLLPSANLYKINAYMAEHFLYMPSMGFFLLIAYTLTIIYRDERYKALGTILMITVILFYSALTIRQNNYWKDPLTFYDRTLRFAPDSASIYYGRGLLYDKQGDYDLAIADYDRAIRIKPDYVDAYNNRGIVYDKKGDYTQAIADYNRAIRIKPDYAPAHSNLIKTYKKIGKDI